MDSKQPNSYPLISVIVPVYNVEKYLARCVDSILSQTYPNIELILIDDGSTDSSPAMCDEFARNDERVRVIHQANGGPGSSRNSGLDAARGELITMVDSDDYASPEMFERLYRLMREYDADMVIGGYVKFGDDGIVPKISSHSGSAECITGEEALKRLVSPRGGMRVTLWGDLYIAELFKDIRFPQNTICEDAAKIHRLLGNSRRVVITQEKLYFYMVRDYSLMGLMRQKKFDKRVHMRRYADSADAVKDLAEYLSSRGMNELCAFARLRGMYNLVLVMLKRLNCIQYRKEIRKIIGCSPLGFCAKLLASGNGHLMARGVKLFFVWIRSMFRPFTE